MVDKLKNYEYTNIKLEYHNEEKLSFHDFIETIKSDLLLNISKNRGFIDEEEGKIIDFEICCTDEDDDINTFSFYIDIEKFDEGDIFTDKFVEDLLKFVRVEYYLRMKEIFMSVGGIDYGDDDVIDYGYDRFDYSINDFIIESMEVIIYTNPHKIIHKKKFYKDLYDDLMPIAWHPSRLLDWCTDIEELKFLKELWGEN